VDDFLITGIKSEIIKVTYNIKKIFKISKSNKADYLLGIKIIKIEENNLIYIISQTQLINDIIQNLM
jgi:hypothetical protein